MPRQIQGSQWNFSFGEVDVSLKRAEDQPARKAGLRQMANARILNSGSLQNRSGRSALYPLSISTARVERFTVPPGNVFDIKFSPGQIQIINPAGTVVGNFIHQGNGANLPWVTQADLNSISYAVLNLSITICFGHSMRPQVVTWDGISTWAIADYTEYAISGQKRTPFYRISPQGVKLSASAQTGVVNIGATGGVFKPGHVGTRLRYVGRQMLILTFLNPTQVTAQVEESLPGSQQVQFPVGVDPTIAFTIGDEVQGATTGSVGIISDLDIPSRVITIQLISNTTQTVLPDKDSKFDLPGVNPNTGLTFAFQGTETIVGPGGALVPTSISPIQNPQPVTAWDDEVMNSFRGFPASVFVDQFRLGFTDFPSVPGGIAWSAINSPTDLLPGANPSNGMFEIAPKKVRVLYVVPGPEGSEFVFCDHALYYIAISPTNPLKPGSVSFQLLSGDGCAQVQPRVAQEAILYVNAGQNSVMAVVATGAYNRPYNSKNLSDYHAHLFNSIVAIAAPSADGTFNERYAYVLNGDGSIVVGKYTPGTFDSNPVIGWGPWSGGAIVSWIAAYSSDVLFTSSYFGSGVLEILDDTQYLDCALLVNSAPAAFAPPVGKGPLWFIPSQSVSLIDQGTRSMGTYQIDANGFIVPQNNGGENLAAATLVAGQPWTMTVEPFAPDATSGADVGQRMRMRSIANLAVYVVNSTGLLIASLFSGKQTPTSPALGTVMFERRFPMWDQGENQTLPPFQRETVEMWSPPGSTYDPRAAIIKDTPGPLMICEIGMEVSL